MKLNLYCYRELLKISRNLNRIDCNRCNGYQNERKEQREEEREVELMKRANIIAKRGELRAYHQSDPRGCSLYLIRKGQEENYNNGEAIC
jgi:hypothetical protein